MSYRARLTFSPGPCRKCRWVTAGETIRTEFLTLWRKVSAAQYSGQHDRAGVDDIVQFFSGFHLDPDKVHVVTRQRPDGSTVGSGIAMVEFSTREEANRAAVAQHRQMMGERYIECMPPAPPRAPVAQAAAAQLPRIRTTRAQHAAQQAQHGQHSERPRQQPLGLQTSGSSQGRPSGSSPVTGSNERSSGVMGSQGPQFTASTSQGQRRSSRSSTPSGTLRPLRQNPTLNPGQPDPALGEPLAPGAPPYRPYPPMHPHMANGHPAGAQHGAAHGQHGQMPPYGAGWAGPGPVAMMPQYYWAQQQQAWAVGWGGIPPQGMPQPLWPAADASSLRRMRFADAAAAVPVIPRPGPAQESSSSNESPESAEGASPESHPTEPQAGDRESSSNLLVRPPSATSATGPNEPQDAGQHPDAAMQTAASALSGEAPGTTAIPPPVLCS
ncbi:hypothetical protein WJX72_010269 [[Myrmecia] bisecta]|uniref:RRM domain-containing protein n=1 Tax=[Myrmecia] bisecta TaxID=41462 RepID=A0AAW1QS93_9CHLO